MLSAHWKDSASKGNAESQAKLEGVPFPEHLRYLWEWARALHGRSGVGVGGLAPLSYTTVRAWAELTDNRPEPHEVEALMLLDAAMMSRGDEAKPVEEAEPVVTPAWPQKKGA